jgi:trehalose 6-phosphate synthase/phosphatase
MVQVATPTTDKSELAATVSQIITRIDSVHSSLTHQPLVFLKQDISFSQYLALLSVADVLMITSLREGMNLTCHEYIVCQDGKASAKKHGPLILSEFTGSASVFGNQEISINPWDYQKCANAIKKALDMTSAEKEKRYNKIRDIVMHHTGESWIIELTKSLAKVHEEHFKRDTMSIPRLSVHQLGQKYKAAKKRLFILDYEGTLASHGSPTSIITTSPERVLGALIDLLMDDKNMVYVMSGCTPEELESLFSRIPEVGFIAENGCFVKDFGTREWTKLADTERMDAWKGSVKGILDYYEERVEGSWVEERYCSLIFHYGNVKDHQSAARHAGDCTNQVNDTCQDLRVHAVPSKDAVLVEPIDVDKGTAAAHILDILHQKKNEVEFLLVAGNDRDDEVIFRYANELKSNGKIRDVTTVSVSARNTVAMTTLTQGTTGGYPCRKTDTCKRLKFPDRSHISAPTSRDNGLDSSSSFVRLLQWIAHKISFLRT